MEHTKIYYLHYGNNIPFYIGKTTNIQQRIGAHKKHFGKNIILETIDEIPTNEWKFWEKHYISLFKSWGFILENKNNGGGGLTTHKFSIERNIKISKSRLGKSMPHKGKKFKEEHKQKIKATRDFLKNRKITWINTPVLQYDLEGNFIKEWSSQTEATKALNKTGDGIGACCRGRQKKAYNYIWKFKK